VEGRTIISSIFARRLPIGRGSTAATATRAIIPAPMARVATTGSYKFRATFATQHLQSGVDLRTVQLWMGHKDLESTMRYLKPARGKDVLTKVNATFA